MPIDLDLDPTPTVLSIQVGAPREHGSAGAPDPMDRPWTTAFFKEPVMGPVHVGVMGLEGDGQADLRVHGGPEKAVLAYAAAHYPLWREELGLGEMPYGGFGENLTVAGQDEAGVCIGDVYSVGTARVQVAQPRGPCWKIARRWRVRDLALRVQQTGRTGWYFRVLEEGSVEAGDSLTLLDRPHPEWTIARANAVLYAKPADVAALVALAECVSLTPAKRESLRRWAEDHAASDHRARLVGPNGD